MDELDFTISGSGDFGNFMWEYPDKIKKIFQELLAMDGGEDAVRGIMEEQKTNILILLEIQLGTLCAGPMAPALAENTKKRLRDLAEEELKLFDSYQS